MYTKNEWQNGDVITKSKLDHAEDGLLDHICRRAGVQPLGRLDDPGAGFPRDDPHQLSCCGPAAWRWRAFFWRFAFLAAFLRPSAMSVCTRVRITVPR